MDSIPESICSHHLSIGKLHLRERLACTARRLAKIESYWSNETEFNALVVADRYMQLSNATSCANDAYDAAWARFKLSILSAEGVGTQKIAEDGLRAAG